MSTKRYIADQFIATDNIDELKVMHYGLELGRVHGYFRPLTSGTSELSIGGANQGSRDWTNVKIYTDGTNDFFWNDKIVATQDWVSNTALSNVAYTNVDNQFNSNQTFNNGVEVSNGRLKSSAPQATIPLLQLRDTTNNVAWNIENGRNVVGELNLHYEGGGDRMKLTNTGNLWLAEGISLASFARFYNKFGDLVVGTNSKTGLRFDDDLIIGWNMSIDSAASGTIDLGTSTGKFNNIYGTHLHGSGFNIDMSIGSNTQNIDTFNSSSIWSLTHGNSGSGSYPASYVEVINLPRNSDFRGVQLASPYGTSKHVFIRRFSDNAGSENGMGAQPWYRIAYTDNDNEFSSVQTFDNNVQLSGSSELISSVSNTGFILRSFNISETNDPEQLSIKHNNGNIDIGNLRGDFNFINSSVTATNFIGNGSQLTNVNANTLSNLNSSDFVRSTGSVAETISGEKTLSNSLTIFGTPGQNNRIQINGNVGESLTITKLSSGVVLFDSDSSSAYVFDGSLNVSSGNIITQSLSTSGNVNISGVLNLSPYTFATLPAGNSGDIAFITDASSLKYRGIAVGGGSGVAVVFFDGSNWIYH